MILQTLIKYFIGITIIIFITWTRFFRKRGDISSNFALPIELLIISNSCLILFFCVIFYINMKKMFNIKKQSLFMKTIIDSVIVQRVMFLIQEYVLKSPQFLYNNLTKNIDLRPILETPGSYFTVYCYYPRIIVLSFITFPLVFVATTFLIDNLFFEKLTHFYQSLIFLIPLLMMKLWLFVLESYSTRRLDHLTQFLIVKYDPKEQRYIISLKPDDQLPVLDHFTKPQIKNKFDVLCDFWQIYARIYSFMKEIDSYRNSYNLYLQIYTSSCFFIGWSIQLYFNIHIYLS